MSFLGKARELESRVPESVGIDYHNEWSSFADECWPEILALVEAIEQSRTTGVFEYKHLSALDKKADEEGS